MAVNLVGQAGRRRAAALLESSFAQFQADRGGGRPGPAGAPDPAVDGAARGLLRPRRLRRVPGAAPGTVAARGRAGPAALGGPAGRGRRPRSGSCAAATSSRCPAAAGPGSRSCSSPPATRGRTDSPQPLVLTAGRQVKRLTLADFPVPVTPIDRMRIPELVQRQVGQAPPGPGLDRAQQAAPATTWPGRRGPRPGGRPGGRRMGRETRAAAAPAAPAPLPRLPGPRGARPAGRALSPAGAGGRGAGAPGGGPHPRDRAHLRPGLRGARRARLHSRATR